MKNSYPKFSYIQKTILIQFNYWIDIQQLFKNYSNNLIDKQTIKEKLLFILKNLKQKILFSQNNFNYNHYLFGIPQGAQFIDLRQESAKLTISLGFPGYSIGGVANGGEPQEIMYSQVLAQTEILEENKPRHLLGVGTPEDIVQMVARGIDMFDCVYPTRNARHGSLILEVDDSSYKIIHINNAKYKKDLTPINQYSKFLELQMYTKSYLCHLFRSKELLAYRLASLQNLEFYINLINKIRQKIKDNTFKDWWQNYKRIQN